jgi:phytol kinase
VLVAIWPFFIGYAGVIVIEILFIFWALLVSKMHWFSWLRRVGRKSWGEYWFPVGIIIAALTARSKWIYLAAALEMGLADAVAAVVGKKFGKHPYKILGQNKSLQGTGAFAVVSFLILGSILGFSPLVVSSGALITAIWLAGLLAVTENIGVYGLDNLLLPLVTVVVLNALT